MNDWKNIEFFLSNYFEWLCLSGYQQIIQKQMSNTYNIKIRQEQTYRGQFWIAVVKILYINSLDKLEQNYRIYYMHLHIQWNRESYRKDDIEILFCIEFM